MIGAQAMLIQEEVELVYAHLHKYCWTYWLVKGKKIFFLMIGGWETIVLWQWTDFQTRQEVQMPE